ncbi:MAG TPA: methyltransferase [Euryarchaeota archaeon]|nr:hypothetical protein BMS3Bbin15_01673 [archaeon BMS3Bbin15]HDL15191.1 methyltransferase [Euryarchaeota archaeon]
MYERSKSLEEIIKRRIEREGAISFRDYMEICLYYPDKGYYTSGRKIFGMKGDYLTSPYITPLFGRIIAEQFIEIEGYLNKLHIVEAGAGEGIFAEQVLKRLEEKGVEADYTIIEPFENLKKMQENNLKDFKVDWIASLEGVKNLKGCIFSNELIDAFPVHLIESTEDGIKEVFVTLDKGEFREVLMKADSRIEEYFKELGISLPSGYRTEVNLDGIEWLEKCHEALKKGYIITIDYGYPSVDLYSQKRNSGTLMCYSKHTATSNPYLSPGMWDMTSHVNFSALKLWGEKFGLSCLGYTDLASFLLGAGAEEIMKEIMENKGYSSYAVKFQSLKTLIMPESMGTTFRVLVQSKNIRKSIGGVSRKPFIREEL